MLMTPYCAHGLQKHGHQLSPISRSMEINKLRSLRYLQAFFNYAYYYGTVEAADYEPLGD